jgi:hypothetical protein
MDAELPAKHAPDQDDLSVTAAKDDAIVDRAESAI